MQDNDWDDEDGPGIDFKFDGDGYLGPLAPKYERRITDKFKSLVQSIVEGGETAPLEEALQALYAEFDKAIKICEKNAAKMADGGDVLQANIEGYNLALDAIEEMDEALANENYVSLQAGLGSLQGAIAQINLGGSRRADRTPPDLATQGCGLRRKKPKDMANPHGSSTSAPPTELSFKHFLQITTFVRRAAGLVWTTSRWLAILFVLLTIMAGFIPGAIAYVSKMLVDAVVKASASHLQFDESWAFTLVGVEGGTVILLAAIERATGVCQSLLRAQLGQRVNVMILEKSLTLDLSHFEDSEFYDKLSQARRQASQRPMSMVTRTLDLARHSLNLLTYAGLLFSFSPWAVLLLVVGGLPTFLVETRFSQEAFRLFTWRSPEARQQLYLESLLASEDKAKEIILFQLGSLLLGRYQDIFKKVYAEDRALTLRRALWGVGLSLLSTAVFYGAYFWVVASAVTGRMTLGEMTMLLMVFKQGQSSVTSSLSSIGGMYEDNLYLNNLYEFLAQPVRSHPGSLRQGPQPGDGVRFENVSFTYPGGATPALEAISFHLPPGRKLALVGENGSGKTTLVKLLARLYSPTTGRVLLDGLDLEEWDQGALRSRIGVIFQDFVRYQFLVGENVGVGDVNHIDEEERWRRASELGLASEFVDTLPQGYQTQLGRWFKGGRELSGGQWQKIALSRAFMRADADILVLDEPTSAVDPRAEVQLFEHFREVTQNQMVILISHRFSTVRMADYIMVLDQGRVLEEGTHQELLDRAGHYAHLFQLQAAGYQ